MDRSAFSENPCACTALQQLAALSEELQDVAPWNDLANQPYCTGLDDDYSLVNLDVKCGAAGAGTQLPTRVDGLNAGLAGAMRPSISALGPILGHLALNGKAAGTGITSVPTPTLDMAPKGHRGHYRTAGNHLFVDFIWLGDR